MKNGPWFSSDRRFAIGRWRFAIACLRLPASAAVLAQTSKSAVSRVSQRGTPGCGPSRSDRVQVAVGFSPRWWPDAGPRRGATLESDDGSAVQTSLRDAGKLLMAIRGLKPTATVRASLREANPAATARKWNPPDGSLQPRTPRPGVSAIFNFQSAIGNPPASTPPRPRPRPRFFPEFRGRARGRGRGGSATRSSPSTINHQPSSLPHAR